MSHGLLRLLPVATGAVISRFRSGEMAAAATAASAFGPGVSFSYREQPRWLFEALAFVEPTFVYISGLQARNLPLISTTFDGLR